MNRPQGFEIPQSQRVAVFLCPEPGKWEFGVEGCGKWKNWLCRLQGEGDKILRCANTEKAAATGLTASFPVRLLTIQGRVLYRYLLLCP